MRKSVFRLLSGILLTVLWASLAWSNIGDVTAVIDGPGQQVAGLAWDGRHLWVTDASGAKIYQLDPSSGAVLKSFSSPGPLPTGLAWDGQYLWCADDQLNRLFQIDTVAGDMQQMLSLSTTRPMGLCFRNGSPIYLDSGADLIREMDLATGNASQQFATPADECWGLDWDGRYFWVSDAGRNEISAMDPEYREVVMILPAPTHRSAGIAFGGEFLWIADAQENRIYQIQVHGEERFGLWNRRNIRVVYTVSTENRGSSTMYLRTYFAVPPETPFQTLLTDVRFSPEPQQLTQDIFGQKIAVILDTLAPGQIRYYSWDVAAAVSSARYFYLPDRVTSEEDIPGEVRALYLRDGSKYRITDPVIKDAVAQAIGDETRYYWKVRRIHDYVIEHLEYYNDGHWDDAPTVLSGGSGSCSEYTMSFIAMCRAAGIPARYEAGGHIRGELPYEDTVFHRWAQVYFPGVGWVPVDCTWDDRDDPVDQARYFGGYANGVLATTIGGGASNYLSWYYNVRQVSSGGKRKSRKRMTFYPYTPTAVQRPAAAAPPEIWQLLNYPNPFNGETVILVRVSEPVHAVLRIVDSRGREVAELYRGFLSPGAHRLVWRGISDRQTQLPSGVYFVTGRIGDRSVSTKMMLLR